MSLVCLLPLFPTLLASIEVEFGDIVRELSGILQCHLCAVEWEVRDTTLEFLCQVLEKYKGSVLVIILHVYLLHPSQQFFSHVGTGPPG